MIYSPPSKFYRNISGGMNRASITCAVYRVYVFGANHFPRSREVSNISNTDAH